jgi:NodT family efflux transporter outer membrane factor (OMF) lipoprotein
MIQQYFHMHSKSKTETVLRCFVLSIIALAIFGGCTMVGPDYMKPTAQEPKEWLQKEDPKIKTEDIDYSKWWTVFNDPVLNTLMEAAYNQNLNLQIAGLRVLQARAQLAIAIGDQYPQQQYGKFDYSYTAASENSAGSAFADLNYNSLDIAFDAAWELDIWGKFRRNVQSSVGNLEASVAGYDDFLVTLTAEVARIYVLIRTNEERLAIARENEKIQKRSLEIADARFKGGAVTELDVTQARSLLTNTQSTNPQFKQAIRQLKNALATLLGKLPGEIDAMLEGPGVIPKVPEGVAVGIPAELLRRRPDVRLAERELAAQSAKIGVAKADLYPHLQLFGSLGFFTTDADSTKAGDGIGGLFNGNSFSFLGGTGVRWDVLNYGRIKNRVRVQDAQFEGLLVNYENTVLEAAREAEDGIVSLLRTQEQEKFLVESVVASKRSVDLSLIQYREGFTDYQRVLDTQRFLTNQQDIQTAVSGNVSLSLVSIYKALGGGWQYRIGKDFVAEKYKEQMRQRTNWGKLLEPAKLETPPSENATDKWLWPDW